MNSLDRKARTAKRTSHAIVWLVLVAGAVGMLVPFYIMLSTAYKTPAEIATTSAWAWPKMASWDNFRQVLDNPNVKFSLLFRNSALIATLSTIGTLITSSLAAYAFARLRFRGRDRLFILLLSTMMLPGIVTMIPTYVLYKYLHWVDTFYPLIVPSWLGGGAFNIFMLRQFFATIPRELEEAAMLDGASHSTIFWRLIMPLSGPALATVGLFSFIWSWRDFLGPLLYLNDPDKQTLELGLRSYQTLNSEQWHLIMAGSVLVMLPLILLFLLGQRYFVRGFVTSGLK